MAATSPSGSCTPTAMALCCDYELLRSTVYPGLSGGERVIVDVAEVLDRADATLDDEHRLMVADAATQLVRAWKV